MVKARARGEKIRDFIIGHVEQHASDIASLVAREFGISRQAANKHLVTLVNDKCLSTTGQTRNRQYVLAPLFESKFTREITPQLAEDVVWREDIEPILNHLPRNALTIWQYAFTEMFNNAIDHSEGTSITVFVTKTAAYTEIIVADNGVGIFKKIQNSLKLLDERHAVLELSKGKLTTDPSRHTGEGIFFSSRMFDEFLITSGETFFSHNAKDGNTDWIWQRQKPETHTMVLMKLNNHTSRTTKQVFHKFASGEDGAFTRTIVPVRLAQYGEESLVSRSQAKRLMARVDRFKVVILDFEGVKSVGQAFADEIFRVFAKQHREVELVVSNANLGVGSMITRAKNNNPEAPAQI